MSHSEAEFHRQQQSSQGGSRQTNIETELREAVLSAPSPETDLDAIAGPQPVPHQEPHQGGIITRRRALGALAAAIGLGGGAALLGKDKIFGGGSSSVTVPGVSSDGDGSEPQSPPATQETVDPTATPTKEKPTSTATPEKKRWAPDSLRELADKIDFNIGTQASYGYLWPGRPRVEGDPYFSVPKDFNTGLFADVHMANPWNYTMMPSRGEYNFKELDYVQKWAQSNDIKLHGHPLVWGTAWRDFFPAWFKDNVQPGEDGQAVLKDYFSNVLKQYKGKIPVWNVVNEPYQPFADPDLWSIKAGSNYPSIAFSAAREADPDAKLILNGVDNFIDTRVPIDIPQPYYTLVSKLTSEGVLDGVGFELHMQGHRPPSKDALRRAVDSFKQINPDLQIYFTEVDVNMQQVGGSEEERLAIQSQIYKDVAEVGLEVGVEGLYLFGNNDNHSWLKELSAPWGGDKAAGTVFDSKGNPKPAYKAIQQVLATEALKEGKITQDEMPKP